MIHWISRAFLLLLIGAIASLAYIRLSPNDPAVWHLDPAAPGFVPAPRWAAFCPGDGSRFALVQGADPVSYLIKLDAIAMATPRTSRLAGSPEQGRITWITRSALIGFPDFTTAGFRPTPLGPQPCLIARQRFGGSDWGVNAARVASWAELAFGLMEPPGRVWE